MADQVRWANMRSRLESERADLEKRLNEVISATENLIKLDALVSSLSSSPPKNGSSKPKAKAVSTGLTESIVHVLKQHPKGLHVSEIALKVGLDNKKVGMLLPMALRAKKPRVKRVSPGTYKAV